VELFDRLGRMFFGSEADECKAAGTARFPIFGDVNINHLADFTKELPKLLIGRGKVEVPDEYLTRND